MSAMWKDCGGSDDDLPHSVGRHYALRFGMMEITIASSNQGNRQG